MKVCAKEFFLDNDQDKHLSRTEHKEEPAAFLKAEDRSTFDKCTHLNK